MAGFLYFVNGMHGALSLECVQDLGLGYAFDRAPSCADINSGPGGASGLIFADTSRSAAPPLGATTDNHQWRKLPNCPAAQVWVGSLASDLPTPSILQRPKMVAGHDVTLGDGNVWHVPAARRYVDTAGEIAWLSGLPTYTEYTELGEFVDGGIVKQYRDLWDAAEKFTEHLTGALSESGADASLDVQQFYQDACRVLQANYYVSAAELAMLQALTFEAMHDVMLALVDWPTLQDILDKKKASDTLTSDGGNLASPPTTAQRLAS